MTLTRLLSLAFGLLILPAAALAIQPASNSGKAPAQAKDPGYGGPGHECEVAPGGDIKPSCVRPGDKLEKVRPPHNLNGAGTSYKQQSLMLVNNCPALAITKRHAVTVAHCIESVVSNAGETWTNDRASVDVSSNNVRFMTEGGSIHHMQRDLDIKRVDAFDTSGNDFCNDTHEDFALIEFSSDLSSYTRARVYLSGLEGTPAGYGPKWDLITWWASQSYKQRIGDEFFHVIKSFIDDGRCYEGYSTEKIADMDNGVAGHCAENGDSGGTFTWPDTYRLTHSLLSAGGEDPDTGQCTFRHFGPMIKKHHSWISASASGMGVNVSAANYSFTTSVSGAGGVTLHYRLYSKN